MANVREDVNFTTSGSIKDISLQAFPLFQRPPETVSLAPTIAALVTGTVGMCANAVVLVVLIFARLHFGSHVNTNSSRIIVIIR